MSNSKDRIFTFSTFGKGRRTYKSLEEIHKSIKKCAVAVAGVYSVHKASGLLGNVCKDLKVPNTLVNRLKIRKVALQLQKSTSGVKRYSKADATNDDESSSLDDNDVEESHWCPSLEDEAASTGPDHWSPSLEDEAASTGPDHWSPSLEDEAASTGPDHWSPSLEDKAASTGPDHWSPSLEDEAASTGTDHWSPSLEDKAASTGPDHWCPSLEDEAASTGPDHWSPSLEDKAASTGPDHWSPSLEDEAASTGPDHWSPRLEDEAANEEDSEGDLPDSSDSSSLEEKLFKFVLPQQPNFFYVERKEWEDLRQTQKGRLFQGLQWTNMVTKGLKSLNPYCSFGFKRHNVKTRQSKAEAPIFQCVGYCRFEDCPVQVNVNIFDESTLKATVVFTGNVSHNPKELKTRPVRAASRVEIAKVLETKLPRSVFLESMLTIPDDVIKSGCRDAAPTAGVMKSISWTQRQLQRQDCDELSSLKKMIDNKQDTNHVLQKVLMHPKSIMLWPRQTLSVFFKRCKDDIVYLDATGSIIQKENAKSKPYYIYELVVRNPTKGASPLPVASYVTCDHTTASVTYFLQAFQTDLTRIFGKRANKRPVMIICDGSLVLLRSLSITFCGSSLEDLLQKYFILVSGQHPTEHFDLPILHRCLSHIMKNAKDLCKKQVPKHYKLAMHVFGLLASCSTLKAMDEVLVSATVLFCSPCSGENVPKHFHDLQLLMQQRGTVDVDKILDAEDYKHDLTTSPLESQFRKAIDSAPLDTEGEDNVYHAPKFITNLAKYFLPHALLWSGVMLGDLGRHGTGPAYRELSKRYNEVYQSKKQNFTQDNRTQGLMEKSQWDLKHIRLQRRTLTRLDDFVMIYQKMHNALLLEYGDKERRRKKSFRVETEKWKKRSKKRKGVYVSPLVTGLPFKQLKRKKRHVLSQNLPGIVTEEDQKNITPTQVLSTQGMISAEGASTTESTKDALSQLTALWKKKDMEVVVSVIPTQSRGNNVVIHHSELCSLRPHRWLTGEVIECLLHHTAYRLKLESTIYVMNHFTAGVILFGNRETMRRQSLSKVNFDNYKGLVSCVNIQNTHWKLLYINVAQSSVYLIDPMRNNKDLETSKEAAEKFCTYFKMRRTCHGKTDWVHVKFRGHEIIHPHQQDGSSCGVIVFMMAKALMEAFPAIPFMSFGTKTKDMVQERHDMALEILNASVFDIENNCAMCAAQKPPIPGPAITEWIQCDSCSRWFHADCLGIQKEQLTHIKNNDWICALCSN